VQFGWQVPLMQVLFAAQATLKTQVTVGFGFFEQKPFWQVSPVPQSVSPVHALWHRPWPRPSGMHLPVPHWPSEVQVSSGCDTRASWQVPLQQTWPFVHCASVVQPLVGGGVCGWQVWWATSHTMFSAWQSASLLQMALSTQFPWSQ